MHAAAEDDEAAGCRSDHEQNDQAERARRRPPLSGRETDAHARRVAAHERHEEAAQMQETDAIDVTSERTQRTGKRDVAGRIKHQAELPTR